jgi:phosphoglycerate dehydrogenase-like enzyme
LVPFHPVLSDKLLETLNSGRLRAAALDTFGEEPPNRDNPLFALPQVITTPHMGAQTDQATISMGWTALEDCLAVLQGKEPRHRIR